jgi:hypothetical protein
MYVRSYGRSVQDLLIGGLVVEAGFADQSHLTR